MMGVHLVGFEVLGYTLLPLGELRHRVFWDSVRGGLRWREIAVEDSVVM